MADVPPSLKPIVPFLTLSKQFKQRDPVVSYYSLLYATQKGIGLSKGNESAKMYLMKQLKELEQTKKDMAHDDTFTDDALGQTVLEECALKHFDIADNKDKNAQFDKGLAKLFYLCGNLFTILEQFGDLSQEFIDKRKYSKWKAVDINRCLSNGITPTPGPPGGWGTEDDDQESDPTSDNVTPPSYGFNTGPSITPPYPGGGPPDDYKPVPAPRKNPNASPGPPQHGLDPYPPPTSGPAHSFQPPTNYNPPAPPSVASYNPATINTPPVINTTPAPPTQPSGGVAKLSATDISTVQKYCKYAASSLDYEDTSAAIDFMEKALRLMKTGKE